VGSSIIINVGKRRFAKIIFSDISN
jgi:hypothetical protein